jgi:hypothetical protein
LRSASKDGREFPLPRLRSRRCTRFVFTGPSPAAGAAKFAFIVQPLKIKGGTGSAVAPIAVWSSMP